MGLLTIWLAVPALFATLYLVSHFTVVNEVRSQAMGVAVATAAGIDARDIEQIHGPADTSKEAYGRIQQFMGGIQTFNPDVRFIYTMRRAPSSDEQACRYEYIVDQAAHDINHNGMIDHDEACEPPGKPYDATALPEMIRAWIEPSADKDVSPDPPYPDLLSGYAPIMDKQGHTVAIVGVDITAATVRAKLLALRIAISGVAILTGLLITLVFHLYARERQLLSEVKTLSGMLPICSYCHKVRDDKGYWEQIEEYIMEHSQAELSHGICPECAKKHFPGLDLKKTDY